MENSQKNSDHAYTLAIGRAKTAYYLGKFNAFDLRGPGLKASWNWSAFAFGGGWALYRKMYGWFFAWLVFNVLLGALLSLNIPIANLISGLFTFGLWFTFSIYANSFYHHRVKKIIFQSATTGGATYIERRGGVQRWVPIVLGLVPIIGIVTAIFLPLLAEKSKENEAVAAPAELFTTPPSSVAAPIPSFADSKSRLAYLRWVDQTQTKLTGSIPNDVLRKEFAQTVWYESKRAGLEPSLVMALISEVSNFRKFYVGESGSRGYMALNIEWSKRIGDGDVSKLFQIQTNLRFGCVVLSHFIEQKKGDVFEGVALYVADSLRISTNDLKVVQATSSILAKSSAWE